MQKEFGVLTNSGSSSNLIMMSALTSKRLTNFPKGTKVITPIAGFPTTINPIFQVGFEPVFVDIELDTLNLNLDQVEERAKEGCKIITFAHVLGNPPNMDRLMEIIDDYGLILLEDCCDALGSTYKDKALSILHTILLWARAGLLHVIPRCKKLLQEVSENGEGVVIVWVKKQDFLKTALARLVSLIGCLLYLMKSLITNMCMMRSGTI